MNENRSSLIFGTGLRSLTLTMLGRARLFCLVVVAFSTIGCSSEQTEVPQIVASSTLRLIEEPSERLLDIGAIRRSHGFSGIPLAAAPERCRTADPAKIEVEEADLIITSQAARRMEFSFTFELDWNADVIERVELEAREPGAATLQLSWIRAGENFEQMPGQTISAKAGAPDERGRILYTFPVADHPSWGGGIRAIRLIVELEAGERMMWRALTTKGSGNVEDIALEEIRTSDWKVDLGTRVHNAVVTPRGHDVHWSLGAENEGRLSFAYGVPRSATQSISFRVTSIDQHGTEDSVFQDTLAPIEDETGRWHRAEVDLRSGARELRFSTSSSTDLSKLPFWGDVEFRAADTGPTAPNVILISIDTLRADRLGVYGYPAATSPSIDRWAEAGAVVFENAISTAPWTLPSHLSMLTGLDALNHGVNQLSQVVPLELELLAETLRQAGYSTMAVTGGGWLHPSKGLAQGFDLFDYWGHGTAAETEVTAGTQKVLELLNRTGRRPFFLFFHTYEVHDPFRRRLPFARNCSSEDTRDILFGAVEHPRDKGDGFATRYHFRSFVDGESVHQGEPVDESQLPLVSCFYDSGIAHVDALLGQIFASLEESSLEDNTLVVLTSDHGESLGEFGYVKHAYLFDTNLRVPLIIRFPGDETGSRRVTEQVSLVDLAPTILEAVGLPTATGIDGAPLQNVLETKSSKTPRVAWSYAGTSNQGLSMRIDNRLKYVFNNTSWSPVAGQQELFDLVEDPAEQKDISLQSEDLVSRLEVQTLEHLRENTRGIHVRVQNSACDQLTGQFFGLPMHIARVKSERNHHKKLEWLANRRVAFRLQSGESIDFVIEAPHAPLTIRSSCSPHPEVINAVDLPSLDTPWQLDFDGRSWLRSESREESKASILLVPVGRRGNTSNESVDQALQDQLRALGYLN